MRPVTALLATLLLALALSGPARADCDLNGARVPEGTEAGGLVCRDGAWVGG
jgi:hypothetical protein